jgi:hypothetical protein
MSEYFALRRCGWKNNHVFIIREIKGEEELTIFTSKIAHNPSLLHMSRCLSASILLEIIIFLCDNGFFLIE